MAGQVHSTKPASDDVTSRVLSHDDSMAGRVSTSRKVCCVCGADVAGKPRMKDGNGTYWCYECGLVDTQRKHPVPCPDCGEKLPQFEMIEFDATRYCPTCANKHRLAAKREAARLAAVEEEIRLQEQRRHRLTIAGIIVGCVAVFVLLYWLLLMR